LNLEFFSIRAPAISSLLPLIEEYGEFYEDWEVLKSENPEA